MNVIYTTEDYWSSSRECTRQYWRNLARAMVVPVSTRPLQLLRRNAAAGRAKGPQLTVRIPATPGRWGRPAKVGVAKPHTTAGMLVVAVES